MALSPGTPRLYEIIEAGAFDEDLKLNRNVPFLAEHSDLGEYGDTESGSLVLTPDRTGIRYRLELPAHAKRFRREIESKVIRGMSFGFYSPVFEVRNGVRYIIKASLDHISAVYSPAYAETSVGLVTHSQQNKNKLRLKESQVTL